MSGKIPSSGKITSPIDLSGFNLDALSGLADVTKDTAKIRGKAKDTFTLYSSNKSEGKHKVEKRSGKQQLAQQLVQLSLDNTFKQIPQNKRAGLQQAFTNIMTQHYPGGATKELTGQELKQIVAEAKDAIADAEYQELLTDAQTFIQGQLNVQQAPGQQPPIQQAPIQQGQTLIDQQARALNKTSTYNESQARTAGSVPSKTIISNLSIEKHIQSIYRLPNKLDLKITQTNGTTVQVARVVANPPSREVFLASLFTQVNTALSRPNFDIRERVETYSNFNTRGKENLNPFTNGVRTDNGDNQDILLLKYATKEMAGFGVGACYAGLQKYLKDNNLPPDSVNFPVRDQVDDCHITLQNNGDFNVESHLQLPLQNSGGQTIGSVRLTLLAAVDATSGNSTIGVNFSNLTFTQQATANDKQHMLAALSTTLPGAT